MPNHVTNILRVSGDPERVSAMFEAVKDDEIGLGSLDFNKVIPKPEALNTPWGSRSHRAMKLYKAFVEESTMLATMNVLAPQPDAVYSKQVEELLTKYEKLTQDDDEDDFAELPEPPGDDRSGGALHTPVQEHDPETPTMPLRTD